MIKRAILISIMFGAFIGFAHTQKAKPVQNKIMSINACADQLVLALANKNEIASLSHYSSDRQTSLFAEEAQKYHKNYMSPEEIIAINPQIILKSPYEKDIINQIIEKRKIQSADFGVPNSISDAMDIVTKAGSILNAQNKAMALNNEIAKAKNLSSKAKIPALIYFSGGNSAGDNTLINEIFENAGFENMAANYGVGNWGTIDTESIIANPPKIIFIETKDTEGAWAQKALRHPALYNKSLNIEFVPFPSGFGYCGGAVIPQMSLYFKTIRNKYE